MNKEILSNIQIYWINLDRSIDRKTFMESQFIQYDIQNAHRISAIDGITFNTKNAKYTHAKNDIYLSNNELACTMSHINAIKQAYSDNVEYAIIMEDDCDFSYLQYHNNSILDMINKNNNIDIIQLTTILSVERLSSLRKNILSKITKSNKYDNNLLKGYGWSTCAYLITRKGMEKILSNKFPITEADSFMYQNLNTYYTIFPYFRINDLHDTTIHNGKFNDVLARGSTKYWDKFYSQ